MTERVKFTHITRTIDPKSGIHYLDAIDENGYHWTAEMQTGVERWIIYLFAAVVGIAFIVFIASVS